MYKKVKGYKRGVYIDLNQDRLMDHDVTTLYKAMKGLGTDEANLIRVLATKTNDQVLALNRRFSHRYGDKGGLVKWIGDDTSGDVKRVLSAMAKDEAVADADAMKKAMKGLGTDDDALIDILADRSLAEIERMKIVFKRTNPENGDLAKWVIDDTSGDFREVMLSLLDRGSFFARRIHDALSGPNKDDHALLRLFLNLRRDEHIGRILGEFKDPLGLAIDLTEQLEDELVMPSIAEIKRKYFWLYSETLETALGKSTTGSFSQMLLAMVEDPAQRDAAVFREAARDVTKNAYKIMELLVTRSPAERAAIDDVYKNWYGKTVEDELLNASASNMRKTLLKLARPKAVTLAHALHEAMKGWGTEDDHLVSLMTHRSKKEVREAAIAYEEIFGMPLIKVVKSDTWGWYEKALCYIIREAFEERVHIPIKHVHLVRDVNI